MLNNARTVRFGPFEVDFAQGELRKYGTRLKISGQPIEILDMLLESPGEIVSRDQISERLWSGKTFVDFDHSLNAAVNKLREALGDAADSPTYIETVPRRGYRFIGQLADATPKQASVETGPQVTPQALKERGPGRRRWVVLSVAALLLVSAAVLYSLGSRKKLTSSGGDARTTIAVLPFENLSGNPAQEYFSDGITEELSTQLARLNPGRLGVIARMTATRYKRSDKSVRQIGNELGVEYLVEGSVRQDGEHVRITAQLVRASDQTHLWASNYDRNMSDILELQSEVARAVAREIGVKVAGPLPKRGGQLSPEIITSYVMMKSLLSRDGYEEATKYLEQLTVSKPDDPEVWSALAMCYFNLAGRVVPQREAIEKAKYAVERALALDPDYPRAHSVRAIIGFIYDKEWQTAEAEHLRAIEADPSDARSQMSYALFLMATGRLQEAEQREALVNTLEPPQPFSCASTRLQYYAGKSADIVAKHAARFAQSPQLHVHCYWYSLAAVQQKQTDGIREAADRLAAASELQEFRSIAGYLYGRIGNEREAREQLRFLQERRRRGQWISAYNLAIIHTGLGEYSRALDLLEEAAKEPNGMLVYLKVDPMWEPLKSNPRFAALMRSAGIPAV